MSKLMIYENTTRLQRTNLAINFLVHGKGFFFVPRWNIWAASIGAVIKVNPHGIQTRTVWRKHCGNTGRAGEFHSLSSWIVSLIVALPFIITQNFSPQKASSLLNALSETLLLSMDPEWSQWNDGVSEIRRYLDCANLILKLSDQNGGSINHYLECLDIFNPKNK